tara:strand:+ start:871 stop:1485 length:615 start_codon:yes stop_codon:yes gene_type:complete
MNLNEITEYSDPFKHWEIFNCLDKETLDEMVLASIPDGKRSYDGTRAADYTGEGIDGKLRLFIDKQNSSNFPNLTKLINFLQTQKISSLLGKLLKKNLSNSYVRLEVIGDKTGFWLKPHKDIEEKLMTMMIWANPYNESESLGTDLYNKDFKLIKTVKYINNNGYFFSSGNDTWHGLELKKIIEERRCIQINYVSFKTDWPVSS